MIAQNLVADSRPDSGRECTPRIWATRFPGQILGAIPRPDSGNGSAQRFLRASLKSEGILLECGREIAPMFENECVQILGAKSCPLFGGIYENIYCAKIWARFPAQILVGETFHFGREIRPTFLLDFYISPAAAATFFMISRGHPRDADQPVCRNLGGISCPNSGRGIV